MAKFPVRYNAYVRILALKGEGIADGVWKGRNTDRGKGKISQRNDACQRCHSAAAF